MANTLSKSFLFRHQIERRIPYMEVYSDGILAYDIDNIYPQRIDELYNRSSAAQRAVKLMQKHIRGKGFVNHDFSKAVINRYGQTTKDLLRLATEDYSKFTGFALLVCYNAFLNIHSVYHIPFEQVRLGLPDDYGRVNYYKIYADWAEERNRINKDKIQTVKAYSSNQEILQRQIVKAGGIQNFPGQLIYYSPEANSYPLSTFDAVINDVDSDARLSRFKNRNIRNKFMPSAILEYPGEFESEDEKEELLNDLKGFQGDEEAGSILLIENPNAKETPLKSVPFSADNNDRIYQYHEESIKQNIRRHYVQPAVLSGEVTPGKLGNSSEFEDAYDFYNAHTEDDRGIFEETFEKIFSRFASPINLDGNFEIETVNFTPKRQQNDNNNGN